MSPKIDHWQPQAFGLSRHVDEPHYLVAGISLCVFNLHIVAHLHAGHAKFICCPAFPHNKSGLFRRQNFIGLIGNILVLLAVLAAGIEKRVNPPKRSVPSFCFISFTYCPKAQRHLKKNKNIQHHPLVDVGQNTLKFHSFLSCAWGLPIATV